MASGSRTWPMREVALIRAALRGNASTMGVKCVLLQLALPAQEILVPLAA